MFDDSVTQKPAERGYVLGTGGRDWERCYAGGRGEGGMRYVPRVTLYRTAYKYRGGAAVCSGWAVLGVRG